MKQQKERGKKETRKEKQVLKKKINDERRRKGEGEGEKGRKRERSLLIPPSPLRSQSSDDSTVWGSQK